MIVIWNNTNTSTVWGPRTGVRIYVELVINRGFMARTKVCNILSYYVTQLQEDSWSTSGVIDFTCSMVLVPCFLKTAYIYIYIYIYICIAAVFDKEDRVPSHSEFYGITFSNFKISVSKFKTLVGFWHHLTKTGSFSSRCIEGCTLQVVPDLALRTRKWAQITYCVHFMSLQYMSRFCGNSAATTSLLGISDRPADHHQHLTMLVPLAVLQWKD